VEEGDHLTLLNVHDAFVAAKKSSKWCKEHFLNYRGLLRAMEIRSQLLRLLKRLAGVKTVTSAKKTELDEDEVTVLLTKCIISGFFSQAAFYHHSGVYKTVRETQLLSVHPTSVLFARKPPPMVIFNEVVQTTSAKNLMSEGSETGYSMRDVTVIKTEWLLEMAPHYYQRGSLKKVK
jgi:ATP-dependent RNA helicase DDX35